MLYLRITFQKVTPSLSNSTKAEIISNKLFENIDLGWLCIVHGLARKFCKLEKFLTIEQLVVSMMEIHK